MKWQKWIVAVVACLCAARGQAGEVPQRDEVKLLQSKDTATWREAEIRLVQGGLPALAKLDASLDQFPAALQPRLKDVMDMALLKAISVEQLDKLPNLKKLVGPDIAKASPRLREWEDAQVIRPIGAPVDYQDRTGFLVPAALKLTKSKNPHARAMGASVLNWINATAAIDQLLAMTEDAGAIKIQGDDFSERSTVGKHVSGMLRTGSKWVWRVKAYEKKPHVLTRDQYTKLEAMMGKALLAGLRTDYSAHATAYEVEEYVEIVLRQEGQPWDGTFPLTNGLRQVRNGKAFDAKTTDEWWDAAGPAWKHWWEHSGKQSPPEAKAWWEYVRSTSVKR
jgi:hypothetical protein